jgi:3'-phosphoadenosine 5'-phosphosulfate sulfotransferase (PAPS reductase)/FAD synthetase
MKNYGLSSQKDLILDKKISLAENIIIEEYMRNGGNIFLSFSGGKDSTVLRHIALRLFPDIKVVFSNTTNELREVVKYVKTFPDVITVFPKLSFKQVIQKEGFPLISKEVSQKANDLKHTNGKRTRMLRYYGDKKGNSILSKKWLFLAEQQFNVTNKCCNILKKDPLEKWAKGNGNPKPIIALMSDESRLRSQLALYGEDNNKKIYPFLRSGWSEADIWAYAKRFGLRFAECYYDRIINGVLIPARSRTGCEYCGFGIDQEKTDRFESSKILTPKRHEAMMSIKNNGITFKEAIGITKAPQSNILGLAGGIVENLDINHAQNKEIYKYRIHTCDKSECKACGSKKIIKDIDYCASFKDTPNRITKRQRVVECHYSWNKCSNCGMTAINDLHLFDLRFNITKRLIDYIYDNFEKKSVAEVSKETDLAIEDIFEIIHFYYYKEILDAHENKRNSIWFDGGNKLIKAS